jgi:hypothetical protein
MLDVTPRLFKMIWDIDQTRMPRLRELISAYQHGRQIHRITSPAQLDAFVASL